MFIRILPFFILVPLVELYILIIVGKYIGAVQTILIVVLAGIIGIAMLKSQGFKAWNNLKTAVREGRVPGDEIINGILILIAGAFLLTPGLLTDAAGFLLLIPKVRDMVKKWVKAKLYNITKNGTIRFFIK